MVFLLLYLYLIYNTIICNFVSNVISASGAWLVAQKAEQRRRFKAVLCAKPRDYDMIREERKRAEKEGTPIVPPLIYDDVEEDEETRVLDGFFLVSNINHITSWPGILAP